MARKTIIIPDTELQEQFVRSSGPGGQNVNKVATAVELRFDVRGSPSLPPDVRVRLERLAGRRLTRDGILIIRADRFRTQEQNRADACERLQELVQEASAVPKRRIATRASKAVKTRRREDKQQRSKLKRTRRERPSMD